jgi:hypothetical protein
MLSIVAISKSTNLHIRPSVWKVAVGLVYRFQTSLNDPLGGRKPSSTGHWFDACLCRRRRFGSYSDRFADTGILVFRPTIHIRLCWIIRTQSLQVRCVLNRRLSTPVLGVLIFVKRHRTKNKGQSHTGRPLLPIVVEVSQWETESSMQPSLRAKLSARRCRMHGCRDAADLA